MSEHSRYRTYSSYLKERYSEKVYKLPINLPLTCPNRINGDGCTFCSDVGTGFEAADAAIPVTEQLHKTRQLIQKKYKANKFIAYFQNYTNTFLPLGEFKQYIREAAETESIVEISVSTRPDCISDAYLEFLKEIKETYGIEITLELGLQTANYHTLDAINRGHGLAEFIDAVLKIKPYHFQICTHVILNLPQDELRDAVETAKLLSALRIPIVKLHSLYLARNTRLAEQYQRGEITICSKEEYYNRVIAFLEHLNPETVVERLFSRIPEADSIFSNWGTSWWKLMDELQCRMDECDAYQGKRYDYLDGAALRKLT